MDDHVTIALEESKARGTARGWVLLVHGFAGNRRENGLFDHITTHLVAHGFTVLRHDWRGLGDSGGSYVEADLDRHVRDLGSIVEWARQRHPSIPAYAIGFSLGAAALGLLERRGGGECFARMAYLSPAVRPKQSMWPRYESEWKNVLEHGSVAKAGTSVRIGRPILQSLRDVDLGLDAFRTRAPLLVCHGDSDTRVSCEFSRQIAQETPVNDDRFVFRVFHGASHSFRPQPAHWPGVSECVHAWFSATSAHPNR